MFIRRFDAGRVLIAAILVACLASACLTSKRVAEFGAEEEKKVEASQGYLEDKALAAYVRGVGQKLVAVSDRPEGPWQFRVTDSRDPNAFALPGGYIFVTRGLLMLLNSEDELAGVLGHEVAHVTADHSVKRLRAAALTAPVSIATGIAGAAVGIVSTSLGNVVAGGGQMLTGGIVIAPFSRGQETEADEIGQLLAAKAGYDPAGISHFLHTLDRGVTLMSEEESTFHFLQTHPMTPERVEKTSKRAVHLDRAPASPVARSRSDFLGRLVGIVIGSDPAKGLFEGDTFMHPELHLAMDFPAGWEQVNWPKSVGAISPEKDALFVLQVAKADSTLDELIDGMREEQASLEFQRFEVRGLPAARTRFADRDSVSDIVFIGYRENVYGIVGQSARNTGKDFTRRFDTTVQSFRALRTKERAGIREARLRLREAAPGETPAAITRRAGSSWKPEQVAVANAVEVDSVLEAGTPVKVAIEQPYTPRNR